MNYKNEAKGLFKEYCKYHNIKFSIRDLKDFLEFLEIDFYDWIKENLREYFRDKDSKSLKE
jgi:hypothetical protein